MKKTLVALLMAFGVMTMSASQAHAVVPTIDGSFSFAGEWDNLGYTYYLNVFDPNEPGVTPDTMDIYRVTLLQELDPAFGGTGDGFAGNDGVYLMIETYATPLTLEDPDGNPGSTPSLNFSGDFLGDGLSDGFNLFMRHFNSTPFNGVNDPAADIVQVCVGSAASCSTFSPFWVTQAGVVGAGPFTGVSSNSRAGGVLYEYYFPTTAFGTPAAPFPVSFVGEGLGDLGNAGPNSEDDNVRGSLNVVPEPSTMVLIGSGLLGLLGAGRFGRKK